MSALTYSRSSFTQSSSLEGSLLDEASLPETGKGKFPTASFDNVSDRVKSKPIGFFDRFAIVAIVEISRGPHRHRLGQFQRLQHEQL